MKKILLASGLVLALVIIAFFVLRGREFETIHPHKGDITEAVYGLGKVKTDKRFEVILGVLSTVAKLYVNEGQSVKKGAPLIEFEDHALFRAPLDGTVTLVTVRAGETALPHLPLLRVEDLSDRYIELSLEQPAALRVRKGQKARISFETLRGKVLEGSVTALFSREDEFLTHITAEGLEPSVLPGMTADVAIEIGKVQNATLVPLRAVQNGMLTVKKNGLWKKIKVEVGNVDENYAEILGDAVSADDEIRMKKGD